MNRKVLRFSLHVVLVSLLTSGSILWDVIPARAEEGRQVTATPFDRKIDGAGISLALAHPSGVPDKNPETLFMISRSFRYVRDARGDRWQSPQETDARHSGDCEDKAIWLFYRLKLSGAHDVRLVIGKFKRHMGEFHVWVTYRDAGGGLCLADPTLQKRIWHVSDFSGNNFYVPLFSFDGINRYIHAG
ncbi:MAG TPA: hypothetical protein VL404_02255 [Candidatus Eisenbacteria bacterium]|nr:hypothetical protein [Candidatus Eisenbacteria bacterium]